MRLVNVPRKGASDVSLVLCGAAGQGVQTVEHLMVRLAKAAGYHVFASSEYMSRVRGGSNSTEIRLGSVPVRGLVDRMDVLVALNGGIRQNILGRIDEGTLVLGDPEELGDEFAFLGERFVPVSFLRAAREGGNRVYANVAAAACLAAIFGMPFAALETYFAERFGAKNPDVVKGNLAVAEKGFALGEDLLRRGVLCVSLAKASRQGERIVLDGSEAIALGALAGGCDFCTGYPMSPATGVLTFLVKNADRFGVAVEQVEDEIAAMNMAVGASYMGALPLCTTSGGGFALMSEGLSLAGIMETPVVVHLAQRPGPATGMATRTEQADLELALYSGHGEFPRILFAPGTLEEAFSLTRKAFELAVRYQTPAIVLTDQYFTNTSYDISMPNFPDEAPDRCLVAAGEEYRRYEESPDGVSPRSVPGFGAGLVCADSHEHDEEGHVYEDFDLRTRMNARRLRKFEGLRREALPPTRIGPANADILVVCWGSTRPIVEEALASLGRADTAMLHFAQVWPIAPEAEALLARAKYVFVVEGNATGQFAALLRRETGRCADASVRTWKGLQFSVEEVRRGLADVFDKTVRR
jgi:2-oxoglutarate ferredoxin oxidoreductase subunit alpha